MLAAVFPDDEVKIIDCIAEEISYKALFQHMQEFAPTWVVFNPVSTTFTHDLIVSHYAKSLGAKSVIISPHSKVFKEEVHERFPSLDYCIDYKKGGVEPEYALREAIKGITARQTRFEDIPPARQDLLPIELYSLPFIGDGYTFVVTARGCPWKCIYCRQNVMNENKIRTRPIDTVLKEIKDYKLKNISFHADTATMNKPWMMEFCRRVKEEIPWKMKMICNSRVDTVDLEMLKAMKKAGFWMIVFGCESGNNEVLRANKKDATVEQARQAIRWAKQAGLSVWGYFMLGMFTDTMRTMQETIDFSRREPFDIVNFAIAAPYPGTEWGEIATERGWLIDDRWESYDQNYSAQVDQPTCSAKEVLQMQRRAYFMWFLSWRGVKFFLKGFRPRYFKYFIKTIRNYL